MPEPSKRQLPESLTRLLAEPTAPIVGQPGVRRLVVSVAAPQRPNAALKIAMTWAVFYNIAGAAILYWLYTTMGV